MTESKTMLASLCCTLESVENGINGKVSTIYLQMYIC